MNIEAKIIEAAQKYDSFYMYDEAGIIAQTEKLKSAFPAVDFLYSIKCNPNSHVVKCIADQGFGADAASACEVFRAERAGMAKEDIYYSAPGKTCADIEKTIEKAIIIADSLDEIKRIEAVAAKKQLVVKIGVRVNPGFSFTGDVGTPSKFGIDEEQLTAYLQECSSTYVHITGLHVHLRSQELNTEILKQYHKNVIAMAEKLQQVCNIQLEYLNMGSGIGITYSDNDTPVDVKELGEAAECEIRRFKAQYPKVRILIETGRFLTGKNGVYATKVIDRKVSRGKTYIIVKNTLNGFVRPSVTRMVAHWAGDQTFSSCEPLFTGVDAFPISALKKDVSIEEVTIVGNLCAATDVIAEDVEMPHLESGDMLMISNAGAYAAVVSPMQFSSQEPPAELFLNRNGSITEQQ